MTLPASYRMEILSFCGRADDQVKVRGFRIEIGEISTVLAQHPAVRECVVVVHPDHNGQNQIVAYIVGNVGSVDTIDTTDAVDRDEQRFDVSDLRSFLQQKLPEYMVPVIFIVIDALPLTPNGKVDYRMLPESAPTADVYVAARNSIEEVLVEIWSQVLGIERISIHANFFELGGHSLLATKLRARIRAVLYKDMLLRTIFEYPSVAEQAAWIIEEGRQQKLPVIVPVGRDRDLPLSFSQQRLWFLDQLEPESVAYNSPIVLRLEGDLSIKALTSSIQKIVQRHESLRTHFAMVRGQAVQIIDPVGQAQINVCDVREKTGAEQEEFVAAQVQQEVQRPFRLTTGPLLRVMVIQLSEVEHIFLMVVHHIVWDGWSFNTFLHELFTLYTAQVEGRVATLPELAVQYADYAVWQREWLQGEVLDQQLAYWQKQLAGVVPLELPADHMRPAVFSGNGQRQKVVLPGDLGERIQELSQREGVTQFMFLLAAFQMLLGIYSRQQDICVGTPVANRGQEEIEHVIGFFINTLVMRTDLSHDPSFLELLQQVRSMVIDAYTHQDIPFEKLAEVLQPERDRSRAPLFQVMFVYQNALTIKEQPTGLTISEVESEKYVSKFDLTLIVAETAQGLSCTVEYSTDLFEHDFMERFLSHWHCLLELLVNNPAQKASMASILPDAEQQLLLSTWNATQVAIQQDSCLHQLFERQVERDPEAIALMYRERTMTYGELNERSNRLARYLSARHQVGPDRLVGISIERSPETIIAVLGVLKAGGGYIPLDPSYPVDRLNFMMEDADLTVLLTREEQRREDLLEKISVVCLDTDWHEISTYSDRNPANWGDVQNIAYVIYTSGSTGTPKGIMVAHDNVINLVHSMQQKHQLTPQSRVLQYMSFNFDVSVVDIFTALLAGARLCLVPADTMVPDEALHELLQKYKVTFGRIPPSILAALSSEDLPHLKTVLTGGDRSVPEVVGRWGRGRQYFNEYGPTETTVLCTYTECFVGQQEIHIGRPIINTRAYILNEALQPVPIGVPGELYIGGDGVSRGYLKRPELTAERFIPEPWSTQPGARLYKTGDLVQYLPTGEIKFLGRTDGQVKIRGFRIELSEIEDAINHHPLVQESVVLGRETVRRDKQLVAYIEVGTAKVTGQELREQLQEKLPAYMIPAHFVFLPALPTTLNVGKIDRQALLAMELPEEEVQTVVAARTFTEELVLACWREVLEREHISILDDFFVIGGHSLLASQLIARFRTTFKLDLPLRMLFDGPSIAEQAEFIEQASRSKTVILPPEIVRAGKDQQIPLSFEQQRLWFLHQLEPDSIAYNLPFVIRFRGILDVSVLERSLTEVIRRHEILRTTFSSGNSMTGPSQQVLAAGPVHMPIITLQEQNYREKEELAQRFIQNAIERPFDLAQDRLFRCQLICMNEYDHILVLSMHHIIPDGWSMSVMIRELTAIYTAHRQGLPSPLPEPELQYADYALWQRNWLRGSVLQEQLDYWKRALEGIEPLNLPTDYPRSAVTSKRGATKTFLVPTAILAGLKRLSNQESVTLFMTLLSVFQILLAHYSQRDDIVVGTVSAHRTQRSLESLIGFFVNMLPLRTKISSIWTFQEMLRNVRETTLDAYAHQDVSFDQIVDAVQSTRDLSTSPIFQVLFMLQNVPFSEQELAGLDLRSIDVETNSAKFDLSLILSEVPQGLSGSFEYSTDLFHAETIQRLVDHFQQLLAEVLNDFLSDQLDATSY